MLARVAKKLCGGESLCTLDLYLRPSHPKISEKQVDSAMKAFESVKAKGTVNLKWHLYSTSMSEVYGYKLIQIMQGKASPTSPCSSERRTKFTPTLPRP